jgi:adenylate cyclase
MSEPWEIHVFDNRKPVFSTTFNDALEMGRQDQGEPAPYCVRDEVAPRRLILAQLQEDRIPRRYVRFDPQPDGQLKITNLSPRVPLRLEQGPLVKPLGEIILPPPVVVLVEQRGVRVQPMTSTLLRSELQSLPQATIAPFQNVSLATPLSSLIPETSAQVEGLVHWLQTALAVLQSAAGASDFYERAARAVVELVGLDSCRVLLRDGAGWKVQAAHTTAQRDLEWRPSRKILDRIVREKRTFWELPAALPTGSLFGIKALIAAPILDRLGEVIGILYGDRYSTSAGFKPIAHLEALLVDLLAGGVAAGLARVEQEQAALQARVRFEQFFGPELSRQLLDKPELLEGRDAEVTVLFCDLRGFSRITDRLGPQKTIEWTGDVLGTLSECVLREQGVLVDYVGDELMAMWGAPVEQPDHAARACRAALAMVAQLPNINARWRSVLGEPVQLGVGISTGMACVGNIGSHLKFKYGPRGTTVNLASRVQGANKYWKTSILLTHQTQALLDASFAMRRLGQVRVVNIAEPVTLFELAVPGAGQWAELQAGYEYALSLFEKKEFRQAARVLGRLLPEFPQDGPALVLMTRAVQCLVEEPETFDPVWPLPGK